MMPTWEVSHFWRTDRGYLSNVRFAIPSRMMECELIWLYSALNLLALTCVTLCTAATYSWRKRLSHNDVNAQPESIFQYCIKMRTISSARARAPSRIRPPGAGMTSVSGSVLSREREPLNECVCVHVPYLDAAVHDGRWAVQAPSYSIHHVLNQIHRFTSVSLSLSVQSVRVVLILLCTNAYKRTGIRTTINRFERSADIKCTPHVVEERSRNRRPILSILLYTAARYNLIL